MAQTGEELVQTLKRWLAEQRKRMGNLQELSRWSAQRLFAPAKGRKLIRLVIRADRPGKSASAPTALYVLVDNLRPAAQLARVAEDGTFETLRVASRAINASVFAGFTK